MQEIKIYNLDCLKGMRELENHCIDSVVTDPPYEIGFMGKDWDKTGIAYNINVWKECFRILKPGDHLFAFSAARTYHHLACTIEAAGFEIRDQMQWIYGSGFPKGLNIGKKLKEKGCPDEIRNEWEGWFTGLKPGHEPIVVARRPISEQNIADNILKWGTGGLNIEASRIALNGDFKTKSNGRSSLTELDDASDIADTKGRYPSNVIFDEKSGHLLDMQSGMRKSGSVGPNGFQGAYKANIFGKYAKGIINHQSIYGDCGGASRFFYCSKASRRERALIGTFPTVKPLALMKYIVRLATPLRGIVVDPFLGSGTTAVACMEEDFGFIGYEIATETFHISMNRVNAMARQK